MNPDDIYRSIVTEAQASRDKTAISVAIERIIKLQGRIDELEQKTTAGDAETS